MNHSNPICKTIPSPLEHEHGALLLELVVSVPLLLLLCLGGIATSYVLNERQSVEFVARETAKAAFHECRDVPEKFRHMEQVYTEQCLAKKTRALFDYGNRKFDNFRITLSRYELVELGATVTWVKKSAQVHFSQKPYYDFQMTRYSPHRVHSELLPLLELESTLFVAEVSARRRELGGLVALVSYLRGEHYAVAII